ncbi:MAG: GH1 family beta-glucosidase [Ginsengibacter sp.]
MNVSKEAFGNNFIWGVATAAYQIEGAHCKNGKGQSIWDVFSNTKGKIINNENGNDACNFYEHYCSDISLAYSLNIKNFRLSISWSRLFPQGFGKINSDGVDYYNRVIDFCCEIGVVPWITLYHWDLPYELEKNGGWTNRDIVGWFAEYVTFCIRTFGDRVTNWMVLNEPMVFTGAGYFLGLHAPGKRGLGNFLPAAHHAALAQAVGLRIIKTESAVFKAGTTFSTSHVEPASSSDNDIAAAIKVDALLNRFFLEPLLGLGYPLKDLKFLQGIEQYMKPNDEADLVAEADFIGLQIYTREIVKFSPYIPLINAKIVKADQRNVERTAMNWEVYPASMYHMLKKFAAYRNIKEIIVTENGAAFPDELQDDKIEDQKRINYLQQNIEQLWRAKQEGVNVNGYFVWTLMDNFEWSEGYRPRFGLVYVDFATDKRVIKASGYWYQQFLSSTSQVVPVQEDFLSLIN